MISMADMIDERYRNALKSLASAQDFKVIEHSQRSATIVPLRNGAPDTSGPSIQRLQRAARSVGLSTARVGQTVRVEASV